jgi:hypothetical protein
MPKLNSYMAGSLIQVTALFTSTVTGLPGNPDAVVLKVGPADGTGTVSHTFGVGPYIVQVGTGSFLADIDSTGFHKGKYTYEWIGTGAVEAIAAVDFLITEPPL